MASAPPRSTPSLLPRSPCSLSVLVPRVQLQEMKIELHSVTNKAKKDDYILKLQSYQKSIAKHKKTLLTQSTSSLNGTRPAISATEKNEQSLEVLKKAHAQLAETEEVGIGVLSNLAKQKETIKHTQANLRETNSQLGYSNKLLNRMGKWCVRALTQAPSHHSHTLPHALCAWS